MTFLRKEGRYWKIYYYLHGKKYKISTRTSLKTFAEQIKLKVENDLAAQKFGMDPPINSRITLKEFFAESEEYSRINKSPGTAVREKCVYKIFKEFFGENKLLQSIQIREIEEFKNKLSEKYSPAGLNIILRHLSAAFSLAVKFKYLRENPFKEIKKLPVHKKQPIFLSHEQAADLLTFTQDKHIHQYIMLALYTGCRISEICNLTWQNVDLGRGYIRVTGKGDKERTIPIPERLIIYLRGKPKKGKFVMTGSKNIVVTSKQFRKYADLRGLQGFTFHNLRDTYASWLAQAGESIQAIKELLGHSTIQTTMIYAHLSQKTLVNAVRSLDLPEGGTDAGTDNKNLLGSG
jgi:integrase